jgi:hypothetical protein
MEEFDAGGDMICQNCEASSSYGAGGSGNVHCQRCGMYLPSHELRMWNSRLYCAYCIMDVQDEEKRSRGGGEGKAVGGEMGGQGGICERCGKETVTLYSVQGRRLCSSCKSSGSGSSGAPSAPSVLSIIFGKLLGAMGVRQKPRLIPVLPPGRISLKTEGDPTPWQKTEQGGKFSLKDRRMVEEEGELGIVVPLSEERSRERKTSPEEKKSFFSRHSEDKK